MEDPQALDLWQGAEHSPANHGHKTPPEVTGDLEKLTPPSGNGGRVMAGSGRKKQTKEGGDAGAEGGTGHETSYSSCLEGSSSSGSQATWFSVTDCSLSAADQEKKRVSFGDCNIPCEPEKRSSLHKRNILKTPAPPHADCSPAAAVAGGEGGGEGRDVEGSGARHGRWSERDLEADKIVNSAALTKKRLKKRSTNSPSQNRQSPMLLILSGHFSTSRRNQSAAVAAREADKVGRRRSEAPAAAAVGCRPDHTTDVYLSGSRRGHRPQTPPPQRRRRCQSSGGIVNQSYKEDEDDREDGEEEDNKRNTDRLGGGGRAGHEGQGGGGRMEEGKMRLSEGSTCYLVHLRDMDRIPKHVDHIIRKFNLRLLEPQNSSRNNNIVDMETASAAMTGRATVKPQQQQQLVAANITPKKKESEEKLQNSSSTSCLEQETTKMRSLSLRRRLSLRFSKKTGSLDKSKSVPGPSTLGQGGGGGAGSSREETVTGPGSMKSPTTSGVEESKDTESCGAAGSSEDRAKTPEAVTSDATYRAQKKAPRWRKLSLHLFRKSRDRVTEEAAQQHPQTQLQQQQESKEKENSDASSREKNDDTWTEQQSPPPPPPAETSEGTGAGLMVTNAKRTSSETSKILISSAQQKTRSPATGQDPPTEAETTMARPAETKTGAKTESNRELTLQQRPASQSPWTTMTMTQASSSDVIVPLVAKTSLVFQDAVFYFPSQEKDDDDDGARDGLKGTLTAAGAVKSEGKVPKPSKSSSLRLPLKGAISETRDEQQLRQHRNPSGLERRRSSLLLRRIRAFFGRSSGSAEEQETAERRMTMEEEQLLTKQDIEMESQCRSSSSLLLNHPTSPAPPPHQINDSIPLLQAESFDPPPPPPPPPHKQSSSSTLSSVRRQSSYENQLPLSANQRSLGLFVGEERKWSGKEDEKIGSRREDLSVE